MSYLRVFGELEDAKDAENADDDERSAALGHLAVAFRLLDDEHDEVRYVQDEVRHEYDEV